MAVKTRKINSKTTNIKSVKKTVKIPVKTIGENTVIQPNIKLLELTKLTKNEIEQLVDITSNIDVMKYIGTGKIWTIDDIKSFIKDEKIDQKLPHHKRQYYSYVILYDNNVVGYISGRKKRSILTKPFDRNPDNIIFRILIGSNYQGKGIGKIAVKLFIDKYRNIVNRNIIKEDKKLNSTTVIIADIDKDNIGSIKTMLANGFKYYGVIKYFGNSKELNRYIYYV